ncbi:hypothetical protein ABR737_01235 [Streptomyces sp. Edi2]|uniref:hypothetical protein n=1 Tax=Streptomyces sp. Edi2 TaxID=3162528 RepID=UPI0033061972
MFLSFKAGSYLTAGEPDHAAAAATESLTLANKIGAPRCAALVRSLVPGFKKHVGAEGVDEFLERMRAR